MRQVSVPCSRTALMSSEIYFPPGATPSPPTLTLTLSSSPLHPGFPSPSKSPSPSRYQPRSNPPWMTFHLGRPETAQMRAFSTAGKVRATRWKRAVSVGFTNHSRERGQRGGRPSEGKRTVGQKRGVNRACHLTPREPFAHKWRILPVLPPILVPRFVCPRLRPFLPFTLATTFPDHVSPTRLSNCLCGSALASHRRFQQSRRILGPRSRHDFRHQLVDGPTYCQRRDPVLQSHSYAGMGCTG